jgi:hypothetical protein
LVSPWRVMHQSAAARALLTAAGGWWRRYVCSNRRQGGGKIVDDLFMEWRVDWEKKMRRTDGASTAERCARAWEGRGEW